ncbi:MAG: alpha/beta hydrolase [Dehalococcoidia bacterium]|nr:alpha/beta hydrolase [Dehalococcoidia bacterium]
MASALAARGVQVKLPSLLGVQSAPPPYWPAVVATVVDALSAPDDPAVVIAHSGAGPLVSAISGGVPRRAAAYIFVDAAIPPLPGAPFQDESAFRVQLAQLAREGVLPPWSRWFGDGVMERLVPNAALRLDVERELPSLPLSYFDERPPVPHGWPDAPCWYLQFSGAYAPQAAEAGHRGWPVRHLTGGHLHMLVQPAAVAECLIEMADELVPTSEAGPDGESVSVCTRAYSQGQRLLPSRRARR